ncbi:Lrp/AsnC family transcriptional regulator [Massilia terrae]|uniref:Lrp/AsnC family transcriptional regulator n=1 Tax=Massilia terrae TaxID=1811224 RepID=A0ABT2D5E4_9BURK|nr:Lrp/AsnC family transcriptional regulator [Massilia terrae]MCS0660578.1 Lrp/AsnC family transcriptional regulator [Massilia terrae]
MDTPASLDSFDIKILEHLQREGRCSNVELAKRVGLSESPCLARTRQLQDAGLIRGYGAEVALDKLGAHVIVFCEVTLASHRSQDLRKFEAGVAKYPEIVECYNICGGYDYLLKIVAPGVAHFQALMDRLLDDELGISKFSSRIVLREPLAPRTVPLRVILSANNSWE